ncbi:MAG: insulinase family protein [Candidatus Eisenbacteria bacterium]|nr:insulinase family protein [Candidatus Eisenbacteria bacterium]
MKNALAIAAAVLLSAVLTAPPEAAPRHPRDLKYPTIAVTMPEYEELSLSNGMTGFFLEDHEIPVVEISMLISVSRPPREKTGLPDLAAWTIRNGGTEAWPADRINEELEFVAAQIEFGAGGRGGMRGATGAGAASASPGGGQAVSVRMNCLKKDLDLVMTILGDLLKSPSFPEDKIELRRAVMIENIRRENDEPRGIAFREFRRIVYGDHPMAWRATEESVSAITRDDLVAFHRTFFRPNNVIVAVSGDVTRGEIVSALERALAGWEPATVTIEPEPEIEPAFVPSVHYVRKDINQAVICMGHLGLNRRDASRPAVAIMNQILGGGSFSSRIMQRVRSDEGLAYHASSWYSDDPWTYGTFLATSQTKSDAAGRAARLMMDIIREYSENGPTAEELATAKDAYLNAQAFEYESKAQVVQRLARLRWEGMPLDTPKRDVETIAGLTIEDVRRVAAEYLHPDGMAVIFVGDESQFDTPLSVFGEVRTIELP